MRFKVWYWVNVKPNDFFPVLISSVQTKLLHSIPDGDFFLEKEIILFEVKF